MKIDFPTSPQKLARTGTMIELPKLEISIHGLQQVYRKHVLVDTGKILIAIARSTLYTVTVSAVREGSSSASNSSVSIRR